MTDPNSSQSSKQMDLDGKPLSEPLSDTQETAGDLPDVQFQGQAHAFPEGGRRAWLTVAGASASLFVSFGWVNCVGIFEEYYQTHQLIEYRPSEIAWIPSLQIFFMLFAGLLVGKVYDDNGPALLLAAGTFLHVLGLMLTSVSDKYAQILLSQSVCSAIGASMVFYPSIATVSTWFLAKRGAALGLVAAGASLGGVIFPIMVIKLLPQVGFGWTMRICAFLILALMIFANLTMRSRIPPNKRPFQLMAFLRPLSEPTFALLTAAVFFFYWGLFIPIIYIVSDARSHGMSERMSNYLVPILNATSIIGRTVPNALADKLGHFNVMIVMSTLTTILILGLLLPATGNVPIIIFAAFFGITSGAGVGLASVLCAKVSPIQDIGVRTGTVFGIASFAAFTCGPIGGKIITDSGGSFRNTTIFAGVSCAIGTVLFVLSRITLGGFHLKKKI